MTQAERIARVAAWKCLPRAAPWSMELRGTQHALMADSVTVAALAQGIVMPRLQLQAEMIVRCLQLLEEEV